MKKQANTKSEQRFIVATESAMKEATQTILRKLACPFCYGEGWVCENHPDNAWMEGEQKCCGGAGAPCRCNKANPPWHYESASDSTTSE